MSDATYKLIVTLLVLVIVIGGGMLLYRNLQDQVKPETLTTEPSHTEPTPEMAPDFTVTDLQGNEIRLSDFAGTPVVVNLWASWCGPCKAEMPHFQTAYEQYGDDVQFLMVNMSASFGDTVDAAKKILEDGGYTFPVYYDTAASCALAYGVTAVPVTLFINGEGELVDKNLGMLTASGLEAGIQSILTD